ncbi:hypothetical protein PGT21_014150 [Puccinia graminis f. sp. tritici]|uniref:Uncharacterized protein n=1 Tax=Puccinia graminis f. sp. tritici TaxID=56615 RepID=A0A5B0LRQ4_PUCGR|nr:hypothetical protein PGTUg99_017395 [Puccinia graminis f. sp. tritici]KAA1071650.1 hypothetical protein PGT21_014150 [Puccinia graminis f. sp. tritici]
MEMNATGAAGALASWAFSSVSCKLTLSELASPEPKILGASPSGNSVTSNLTLSHAQLPVPPTNLARADLFGLFSAFTVGSEQALKEGGVLQDWGGDLMNVEANADNWSTFETGPVVHKPSFTPLPSKIKLGVQATNKAQKGAPSGSTGSRMKLGQATQGGLLGLKGKPPRTLASLVAALEADNELNSAGWGVTGEEDGETKEEESWNNTPFEEDRPLSVPPKNTPDLSSVSSKESKAAHMARMKEERRAKMAALKAKNASASTTTG